jgi:hypothetical protein
MNEEKTNNGNKWRCADPCGHLNYFENEKCVGWGCGRDRPEDTARILIREAAELMRNSGETQSGANIRQAFLRRVERHLEGGYETLEAENERLTAENERLKAENMHETAESAQLSAEIEQLKSDSEWLLAARETKL